MPVSIVLDGANIHDVTLAEDTLDSVQAKRSKPTSLNTWHFEAERAMTA